MFTGLLSSAYGSDDIDPETKKFLTKLKECVQTEDWQTATTAYDMKKACRLPGFQAAEYWCNMYTENKIPDRYKFSDEDKWGHVLIAAQAKNWQTVESLMGEKWLNYEEQSAQDNFTALQKFAIKDQKTEKILASFIEQASKQVIGSFPVWLTPDISVHILPYCCITSNSGLFNKLLATFSKNTKKVFIETLRINEPVTSLSSAQSNFRKYNLMTPLQIACHKNDEYMVLKLLKFGADANIRSPYKKTPLQLSCTHKNPKQMVITWLLEYGAIVDKAYYMDTGYDEPFNLNCKHAGSEHVAYKLYDKCTTPITQDMWRAYLNIAKQNQHTALVNWIQEKINEPEKKSFLRNPFLLTAGFVAIAITLLPLFVSKKKTSRKSHNPF